MPRCVRNFWLDGEVDGASKGIGTGPKSSGGGFYLTILIRENGQISNKCLRIRGGNYGDKNILTVDLREGEKVVQTMEVKVDR